MTQRNGNNHEGYEDYEGNVTDDVYRDVINRTIMSGSFYFGLEGYVFDRETRQPVGIMTSTYFKLRSLKPESEIPVREARRKLKEIFDSAVTYQRSLD